MAISVFDKDTASPSIRALQAISFQSELPGFIVKIDRARGDYANICLAYSLAREMALLGVEKIHGDHLNLLVKRMVRDLGVLAETESHLDNIEESATATLKSVELMRTTITDTTVSLDRTQEMLKGILAGETSSLDQLRLFFKEREDK